MSKQPKAHLLFQRRFGPFFLTQFTGAFADNIYKNLLILLVTYHAAQYSTLAPALLVNLAAGIFVLPFLLFSAMAGQLADKYDKARVIQFIKLAEVGIMGIAAVGLFTRSITLLLTSLFLMGTHSSFFGPVKYSMLPRVLHEDELVGGNGLVEMGTFLAILAGTIGAGLLVGATTEPQWLSAVLLGVAGLGALLSFQIPRTGAAAPDLVIGWNPLKETLANLKFAKGNRPVFLSLLGISWFWFFGALLLSQFANYSKDVLGGNENVVTVLLSLFSVGVAVGSLLCEKLSGHKVEIGLVPFGSIGLTVFAVDLFFASPATAGVAVTVAQFFGNSANWRVILDLVGVGVFGGFYIVPLYALVQSRTEKTHQSRVISANNILNAVFMIAAAGIAAGLLSLGCTIPQLILACGLLNAVVAVYIYTLVPEFLWRFCAWILANTLYRIKSKGLENIPESGPALLVCNHVSYVDALVIAASVRRPIRFVMDANIFKAPVLGFLFRAVKAIPIGSSKADLAALEQAFGAISEALTAGELVCIFPEGGLTRDGKLQPFRRGVERIQAQSPVPVVPMAICGMWGGSATRCSVSLGQRIRGFRLFRKIEISADVSQTEPNTAADLRERVLALRGPDR